MSGSGLITGQRLFDRFNEHLNGAKIEDLATRFVAIATELDTVHEIWLRRGLIVDAVRASSAIPGLVRPVRVNRRWLVVGQSHSGLGLPGAGRARRRCGEFERRPVRQRCNTGP